MRSLVLLLICLNSFATVVFIPLQQKQYVPGDFIAGTLKFDPKFEGDVNSLKGKNFLGSFYVSELSISGTGQAEITLVPLGTVDTQKALDWGGRPVDLSALRLGQSNVQPKGFIILEHALNQSFFERFWPWLTILLILALMGALWWKIRKNKMSLRAILMGKEKKIALWREKITKAQKRDDFEMIYDQRKVWMPLLEINKLNSADFFETLNKHQYKKEWNDTEFNEVKESYLRFKNGI